MGKAEKYHDLEEWRNVFLSIQKPWVVYSQAPSDGAIQTLEYLSCYTHSVAISEHFIKKFVKHILPSGYHKIRYFSIWAMTNRKTKLAQAQRLLHHKPLLLTMQAIKASVKEKLGIDPTVCSDCGSSNIVCFILTAKSAFAKQVDMTSFFKEGAPPQASTQNQTKKVA